MGPNIVEPFHFRVRQLRFLSGSHIAMEFQIHLALLDRSATRSQNLGVDCMDQDWDTHAPQHWLFLFGWSIIIFIRILPHYIRLHHTTSYYIILHHITSYYIILDQITSYYIRLHHITSYYIILHHTTSY